MPAPSVGDLVETEQLDGDVFGRIGAQTAKQIVLQRIREVERDQVFDQFASREGELMTGTVNRVEPRAIILDVGKNVEAILATTEQSALEHYRIGQNVKAFVLEVRRSTKGPQIFVSRTHKGFLKRLFELEVPEIHSGTVEIKAIAREAGQPLEGGRRRRARTGSTRSGRPSASGAPASRRSWPSCRARRSTSSRGATTPSVFVANALSPAQVISVDIDEEHRIASVTVPERMLSLAIGREGQNARLAARLTGWRIDIRSDVSVAEAKAAADAGPPTSRRPRPSAATESPSTGRPPTAVRDAAPAAKPKRVTKKAAAAAERTPTRRRSPTGRRRRGGGAPPSRSARRRRRRPRPTPTPKPRRPPSHAAAAKPKRATKAAAAADGDAPAAEADGHEAEARDQGQGHQEGRAPFPPGRWRRSRGGQGRRAAARPKSNLRRVPDGPSEARAHAHRPDGDRRRDPRRDRSSGRTGRVRLPHRRLPRQSIDQGRPQPGAQDPAPAGDA